MDETNEWDAGERAERRGLWRSGDGDGTGRGGMRGLTLGGGSGRFLSGAVGPSREIRALDVLYGVTLSRTHSAKKKMTYLKSNLRFE